MIRLARDGLRLADKSAQTSDFRTELFQLVARRSVCASRQSAGTQPAEASTVLCNKTQHAIIIGLAVDDEHMVIATRLAAASDRRQTAAAAAASYDSPVALPSRCRLPAPSQVSQHLPPPQEIYRPRKLPERTVLGLRIGFWG